MLLDEFRAGGGMGMLLGYSKNGTVVPLSLTRNRNSGAIACDHTLPPVFYVTSWGGQKRLEANARLEEEFFSVGLRRAAAANGGGAMIAELKEKVATTARARAVKSGLVPRRAYQHYFIEDEGLHSRIHLQNFWSTFWPQFDDPATAHVEVIGADGKSLGHVSRSIPRFGSMFLEMRDVLSEVGARAPRRAPSPSTWSPPPSVVGELHDIPKPLQAEINTPYWMAYYDDDQNYMYVHSIDKFDGAVFGTSKPVESILKMSRSEAGGQWRSWRLLEVERLGELQIVAINHSPSPGQSKVGFYATGDDRPLWERELEFGPRQLHRVSVSGDEIRAALDDGSGALGTGRIGMDPLLTGNGKPYVLMRYGGGPLSLHHG